MPPVAKANYGIDAPGTVFAVAVVGIASSFVGIFVGSAAGIGAGIGPWALAVVLLLVSVSMIVTSKVAKPRLWGRELDALALRGDEQALDAGCGRGVVTVALARRLPHGSVVGVDIWRNGDQSGNSRRNAQLNVDLAAVGGRVDLQDGDLKALPFADATFDVVTVSLALGTIRDEGDRRAALDELRRVARPGARVLIVDSRRTGEAEAGLQAAGWDDVSNAGSAVLYPRLRVVRSTKPGA